MQIIQNAEQFKQQVLDFDGIALVDFYADRCGPCKMLGPIIEQLAEQYQQNDTIKIIKIDVDQNPEIAGQYGVMSIPTVIVFKKGEVVFQQVGVQAAETYKNKLEELANS
jgi:thioredoxin 1